MKPCPYCAELIQDQAAKCRYCGEWLDPSKRPAWSQEAKAAAAAVSSAPSPKGASPEPQLLDDDDDDPPLAGPGATLPVGSGLPDLGRREPEPARAWSAPAWLANAQTTRVEPREDPPAPTDRSTLEEVALRMERIRQSAAAVRDSAEPTPRAVRPTAAAPERATLEDEPGVTLAAGSLRGVGIDPRDSSAGRPVRARPPARTVAQAPTPAPVVHDDELADFEDEPAPRARPRSHRDELLSSERPTVPDIPREQLLAEAYAETARRRQQEPARAERPARTAAEAYDEPELAAATTVRKPKATGRPDDSYDDYEAPTRRSATAPAEHRDVPRPRRKADALPPNPELPGPPTERVRTRRAGAHQGDDHQGDPYDAPPTRKTARAPEADDYGAPPAKKAVAADPYQAPRKLPAAFSDEDEDEADDELPPPRAATAAFDDGFLDDEDDEERDDDEGDEGFEDFGGSAPAPRPLPWRPILIAAGVVVVAGVLLFRNELFPPGDPETDEVAEADAEAEAEAGEAPAPAGEAPPPAKALEPAPTPQQPAQPEAKADAGTSAGAGTPVADAGQPPKPPEPAPVDADTKAALDEIRKAYDAAGGNPRKLAPVGTKLQEILAKAPNNPEALTFMAQVYLEQGKIDDSLQTSNHCTAVAPTSAGCWLTIGVIQHEFKRDNASAKAAFQKYLELDPDGRYAKVARLALKKLK